MASHTTGPITQRAAHGPPTTPRDEPLTFLFTDVEGSTRLWEANPETMRSALERHDAIIRSAIADSGGEVVKTTGDGLMAVFAIPVGAVTAAVAAQRGLFAETWPHGCAIRVRMGIHTGEVESRGGDFFGPAVNRTARIMSAGHGGQVLLSEATAGFVEGRLPAGATLRDLGEHRLKDLGRSQRLFQLAHPGLPAEFAPLSTLDLRPNNLPTETSAFVGRDAELRAIRERLDDEDVRLVTLTGPGGSGKTRLAIRAAADQIDRFTDGVYFVELVTATDSDAVLALIATAIGLGDAAERSPLDELRRQLRAQQVLIVLDNFEQVDGCRADARRAARRLPGPEGARDEPPGAARARRARGVGSATVAPSGCGGRLGRRPQPIRGDPAVRRAGARRPAGLPADRRQRRRGRRDLPPARRAAPGDRARDRPPEPLLARRASGSARGQLQGARQRRPRPAGAPADASRDDRMELPAADARGAAAASSCCRSSPERRSRRSRRWRRTWTTRPARSSTPSTASARCSTRASSGRSTRPTATAMPRVVMLETIKAYATAQLDTRPDFAEAAREGHARYFADLARTATTESAAAELDNLRIAWANAVGRKDLERLGDLREALWPIYEARGWYHATIQLADDLLAVRASSPERPNDWQTQLTLMTSRAKAITLLRGYTAEAEDAYAEALALVKEHGEVPQLFPVLRNLGSFYGYRGELDKAIEYATEILRLADTTDDAGMRVTGYTYLGANTGFAGQLEPGLGYLDQAIATFESSDYVPRRLRLGLDPRVSCLTTSGFFLWLLGYPDRAAERAERAIARRDRPRPSVLARVRLLPRRVPPSLAPRTGRRRGAGGELTARGRDERPAALASARDRVAGSRDERPGPARGGHPPDGRRPRSVPGPADAAGLLADDPLDAGRRPRRRRHARPRLSVDRRGPRDRRQRHGPRPAVPHRPRRPVAARPGCGPGRRDGLIRACLRCGGRISAPG